MTDFSKIQTIDELDFQAQRMERRAEIQYEKLNGHVDFVVGQYNFVVNTFNNTVAPIRNTINECRTTVRVLSRIISIFIPKKKKK